MDHGSHPEIMEEKTAMVELLVERATDFGKTSFQLFRLKAIDKTSEVVSALVPRIIVLFFVGICALFASLGLGVWLGEVLATPYLGFMIVAGGYGLIGLVLHVFVRRWMKRKISNLVILKFLK